MTKFLVRFIKNSLTLQIIVDFFFNNLTNSITKFFQIEKICKDNHIS